MPELPEVETVANGVHERVRGARIHAITIGPHKEPLKSTPAHLEETLTGARIERVRRVGKTIVMDISQRDRKAAQMTVHLGMTGRLLVSKRDVPMPPHTHVTLHLHDGRDVRFVDPRRFGRVGIVDEGTEYEGPGKEPLTITLNDFVALFKGRKTPIKSALLNQSLLHGVGNIYADESLFRAGIRPKRHAGRLTRAELTKLHAALQTVLKHAIQLGGSSVSDYVDADGVRGFFQLEHRVYSRTGEPCKDCAAPVQRIVLGGRSTHFCKTCQK
ncbi:formamidopyrimidine-DNA glycosylase Fpg [Terriglobus roseus DSM 18391]|uniref:Formamidopyrimidine-DNA glycosylase n=1 Tax=Terriglobus roseus (strain DSM 18391 / NRRL B-41598 / KBS 63) TaxID=926566 RepID=I3ZBP1_TERRK|nr:bifunctional DNA-formamidopyrimidine glycosylase/DNA-(apurinic or apyrimidinic site) lyase [Terriglobus roseus]AFL86659.1 formamidopyrimidine-DNA glycosylase Fpg [Terriglobus roseus DSM 18391]